MRILALIFPVALPITMLAQSGPTAKHEVALARSAGPAALAEQATVYVLGSKGYVVAATGSNGFSCLVEHDRPETTEPICYDAEGTATLLPVTLRKAELRAAGVAEGAIAREIAEGYRSGKYRPPTRTGVAYMLSTEQTVFDPGAEQVIPYVPHLMFYAPYRRANDLGMTADHAGPGLPFLIFEGEPNAMIIVPVAR